MWGTRRASWARRVEVRLCEWRRFGLGMKNSSLKLAAASEINLRYISNSRLAVVTPAIPRSKPINAATSRECL